MAGERGLPTNNSAAMLQALASLVPMFTGKSGSQTTSTSGGKRTTQRLDDSVIKQLQDTLTGGQFSKQAAVQDSQGAVAALVQQMLEQGAPQIAGAQIGSGTYNASTTKLLNDNLTAKAAAEGATLQQKSIAEYAAIQSQIANTLANAKTTEVTSATKSKTKTSEDAAIDPMLALGVGGALWGANKFGLFDLFSDEQKKKKSGSFEGGTPDFNPSNSLTDVRINPGFGSSLNQSVTPAFSSMPQFSNSGSSLPQAQFNSGSGIGFNVGSDGFGANFSLPIGCFITTAVCKAANKPDDCYELVTLRHFRDSYMNTDPTRAALVQRYYQEAPHMVSVLDSLPKDDSELIYDVINTQFIKPAITAIEQQELELAMDIYINMVDAVRELVASITNVHTKKVA